jgi:colanic acid/amylovoran biosynthesis glycosyltransferase
MRILVVTWGFPRRDQRFLVAKAEALARRGHDVCVLCAPGDTGPDVAPPSGVRIRAALRERPRALPRLVALVAGAAFRDPRFVRRALVETRGKGASALERARSLERILPFAGERPDVVHFEFANWAAAHLDVLTLLRCPTVVTCHGSDLRVEPVNHPSLRRRLRAVLGGADRVVCVSDDLARLATGLGADPATVVVISEGVDTTFFTAPRSGAAAVPADGEVRLTSVGRLHWVKGYEYALQAVRTLRDRGHRVSYTIAGQDEGAGDAVRLARRDLGLESVVHLVGAVNRIGVRNLLAATDVFVLPSLSEGLCMSALEAMSMGVPVVTTDVGGMSEAVADGLTGLVVPPRDPRALADAVSSLVSDEARRTELGANGAELARRRYDAAAKVDRLVGVFDELVHGH